MERENRFAADICHLFFSVQMSVFGCQETGDFRKRTSRRFDRFSKVVKSFRRLNRDIHFQKSPD